MDTNQEPVENVPVEEEAPAPLSGALIFSKPSSLKADTAEAFSVSVVLHVAAAIAAVWLTLNPPEKIIAKEDILIPMVVQEQAQHELPPPPPPPGQKPVTLDEIPKGFQTLSMPTVIPPDIPPPTAGPEIDEADFSGEGAEGGLARGKADPTSTKVVTAEDLVSAPSFTPYTVAPTLKNRAEVEQLLVRMYPPMLRDLNMGGVVMMWILVDERGQVRTSRVKDSSGLPPLDSAAIKVVSRMVFTPAQNRDVRVPVWVALPVNFRVQ